MGLSSLALYSCLTSDLSSVLRTLPEQQFTGLSKARDCIWPGISGREVASLFLLDSILKKNEDEVSSEADSAALAKFLACNSHCESFRSIDTSNISSIEEIALGEFRKSIADFFFNPGGTYWLDPQSVSENLAPGPGASVGVTGPSFYQKIAAGPMTGTQLSLYSLYKREASRYPLWDETEKIRSDHFGGFKQVKGSRLSFVPKSNEISRTICTEPLLNMLFQKGVGKLFELQLNKRFGINLSRQPEKNKMLAWIGSCNGRYGTIDLASASDTISLNLLKEILPSYVNSWLLETRSEFVTLPNGQLSRLHMVSSMGNAFTFPLQTILFSSVVLGVYHALDIKVDYPRGDRLGNFSVFGDDIVVRVEAYDLVIKILGRLGFLVNHTKSYNEGPFRESCGSDFWSGLNVRGVYCHKLKTKQDAYSLVNRLNVWSANHEISLPVTIKYLVEASGMKLIPVPPWESDTAGVKMPLWLVAPSKLRRDKWTGSIVYSRYLPRTNGIDMTSLESRPPRSHQGRNLLHNPAGILLSAIGGYLRNGELLLKGNLTYYKMRMAIAPCWDYWDPCHSILTNDGWHRWKSFGVAMNLEVIS